MKKLIMSFVFLLFSFNALQSQHVFIKADRYKALIGQKIVLDINVNLPNSLTLDWPVFVKDTLGVFEITNQLKVDTAKAEIDGFIKLAKKIEVICFEPGMQRIPGIDFKFYDSSKKIVSEVKSDELIIDVSAVQVDTTAQIKDIKEIMEVPLSFEDILPWLGIAALIFLLIGIALLLWHKFRKKPEVAMVIKPKIKPYDKFLLDLQKIKEEQLWRKGEIKAYHSEIADALRTYIENEWKIRAMELTSDELFNILEDHEMFIPLMPDIKKLFTRADLVKFAKFYPGEYEHLQSLEWLEQIATQLHASNGLTKEKKEGEDENS